MSTTQTGGSSLVAEASRTQQLRVVLSPGPVATPLATLGRTPVVLGREPGSGGLLLEDTQVSRRHASVEPDGEDGFQVVDLGSRNGVFVDGERVERARLAHGALLRLGQSILVYVDVTLRADVRLERETPELAGSSLVMQALRGELSLLAPSSLPVLITGETGSGKDGAARELHRRSRREGRFVPVNCAALPRELAESELFGHHAGAFTGATGRNEGIFVAAHEGTLFLDEIGELAPEIQAKLLRALSGGEVRAVGRADARTVDVRVVTATHRDLAADVAGGRFRADLHARLSGTTVTVPPLRARREDILRLARLFLERVRGPETISANAAEALLLFSWPYNVRQLEQVAGAAAVKAAGSPVLHRAHLPDEITARLSARAPARPPAAPPLEATIPRDKTPGEQDLRRVLEEMRGNLAQVAEFFGKDRRQIYRWAERYAIDLAAYRADGDRDAGTHEG